MTNTTGADSVNAEKLIVYGRSATDASEPSQFAAMAAANAKLGVEWCGRAILGAAILNDDLSRQHVKVLAVLDRHMNRSLAKTFVSRDAIACEVGISAKAVSNRLLELRKFKIIVMNRERVPDGRSLAVYTYHHDTVQKSLRVGTFDPESPYGQGPSKSLRAGTLAAKVPPGRDFQGRKAGPTIVMTTVSDFN